MRKEDSIFIAGSNTFTGIALRKELLKQGYNNIIPAAVEPDLTNPAKVTAFFADYKPLYVFLTAGKSGGIRANQKYPAELIYNNLLVQCHVIENAYRFGCKKLLFLASSCSYPRDSAQPITADSLLTGPLEPTNEPYAVAKIAGIKMCQAYRQQYGVNFITAIPANAFGPDDDFSEDNSHVIPALIRKMHEAKIEAQNTVTLWGTGTPRREFIFVNDLAKACIFVMRNYDERLPINIGTGQAYAISEMAALIKQVVGFTGKLQFDTTQPDGMPIKLLDSTPLRQMGWQPQTPLRRALEMTYTWFVEKNFEQFMSLRGEKRQSNPISK